MARKRALDVDEAPELIIDLGLECHCERCGSNLHSGGRSRRSLWRLDGPVIVVAVARRCSKPDCAGWHEYQYDRAALDRLALRTGDFGLDVILRIGQIRVLERQSVPEIHKTLSMRYPALKISERQVTRLLHDYEALAQASLLSKENLHDALEGRTEVVVSVDGLKPDQEKDALWIVRDLKTGLPLASMTHPSVSHEEIVGLFQQVLDRGLTITGVVSDAEECILKAVAEVLPGVPHQTCQSHFLGNLAKPLQERDAALRKRVKKGSAVFGRLRGSSKLSLGLPPTRRRLSRAKSLRSLPRPPGPRP